MASDGPANQFIETFVLPLVAGGRLQVRGLLGPGVLQHFVEPTKMDGSLVAEVTGHMRVHLARLGPVGSIDLLAADALALAAVWHNLLAMTHPDVVGRQGLRRRVREWSEGMLTWVGPPRTAADVANRHGMLARLGEVGRVDTDVTFWAGSARYLGIAPPARLLAWKTVRRVREHRVRVGLFDLLAQLRSDEPGGDLLDAARTALALSPLTDVALADRPSNAGFAWTPMTLNALGDAPLRGAIVRLAIVRAPGMDVPPARIRLLEQATREIAQQPIPSAAAQLLVRLHLEALVADALGRGGPPAGHALAWDAIGRLGPALTARIVGLASEQIERALGLDERPSEPHKDAPSATLLSRAGFSEVSK